MKIAKWLTSGFLIVALALQAAWPTLGAGQQAVNGVTTGSKTVQIGTGKRIATFVTINLNDTRLEVRPVLAHGQIGKTQSLADMAKRSGALAAINGSFFMAYNKDAYKPPWGKIVIDYKQKNDGTSGSSIGFNGNALPVIDQSTKLSSDAFEHITSAGPTLVKGGKVVVNPQAEGMNDPKLTTASSQRSFIGFTADNHLVMGTVPNVTLAQLAVICQSLGLNAAMNLDGGASSGLYAKGQILTQPGRELSNAIIVVPRTLPVIQVTWQAKPLSFSRIPVLIEGTVYVSAKEAFEKLGASVTVDQQEKLLIATKGDTVIRLSEQGRATINGKNSLSYIKTRKIAGELMVPLRFVAESMNATVGWNAQTRVASMQENKGGAK